jgi:ABC-type ATPase involved in cell division
LIRNPEFLVADEPTWNIDQEASRMIADTCININKQGTTILFITHDLSLIEYVKEKHNVTVVEIK